MATNTVPSDRASRRPARRWLVASAALTAGLALAASWAVPANAATAAPGTVSVQIVRADGTAFSVGGIAVALVNPQGSEFATTRTNPSGAATFRIGPGTWGVTAKQYPTGVDTLAPARSAAFTVAAGETTRTTVTMVTGGVVSGRLIGPGVRPAPVLASGAADTIDFASASPDANGDFTLVGLATGDYTLSIQNSGPLELTSHFDVRAQTDSAPAERETLAPIYLHSRYDLSFTVTAGSAAELDGATVRVVEAGSAPSPSASGMSETLDSSASAQKSALFQIPSGDYDVIVTTVATSTAPATTYYDAGPGSEMSTDARSAAAVTVVSGSRQAPLIRSTIP